MRIRANWILLFVLAANCFFCGESLAASLNGKVVSVNDGDEITISNMNRHVRIKLVGIDAPEPAQAFGAAAKQHLFDLVQDKFVTVEYSGIGQHSTLIGRVLHNETDICAQMIRDGAAWFDPSSTVSGIQREIYIQSEQAARNEKRGLWQNGDAIAPWEFVKAEDLKRNPVAALPTVSATRPVTRVGPRPELNSLSLLRTGTSSPKRNPVNLESEDTTWLEGDFRRPWRRIQPNGENFSALVPGGGEESSRNIPFEDKTFKATYYRSRDGHSLFEVVWFSGPYMNETDDEVLQGGLNSIIAGVGKAFEDRGIKFTCDPTSRKLTSTAGFIGREYDLTSCPAPGYARVFTKAEGANRVIYLGFVFFKEDDANIQKFLKSFTISPIKKTPIK